MVPYRRLKTKENSNLFFYKSGRGRLKDLVAYKRL